MEPKPVESSRTPNYPTRRDVLTGAAAFALVALGGQWRIIAATAEGKIVVAPIFEHGTGRGAEGCFVVSPPVFLSEEEAIVIIREVLAKRGVMLKDGTTIKDTRIPERLETDNKEGKKRVEELDGEYFHPAPLKLSGVDPKTKIGVTFISEKHYSQLGGPLNDSSAREYDFREVAGYVAGKVKQSKEPIYLGIFYDPAADQKGTAIGQLPSEIDVARAKAKKEGRQLTDKEIDSMRQRAQQQAEYEGKEGARKLLREQVDDFVAWLKKQKAIP